MPALSTLLTYTERTEYGVFLFHISVLLLQESYTNVYNWQYINCLQLWVHVLSTYASKKELLPLVYPVTQIITGVAQLVPTTRYFPLRVHCVKLLNKIAKETGTFIPVARLLLEMLEFKELNQSPTGGVGKSIDFNSVLKVTVLCSTMNVDTMWTSCCFSSVDYFYLS